MLLRKALLSEAALCTLQRGPATRTKMLTKSALLDAVVGCARSVEVLPCAKLVQTDTEGKKTARTIRSAAVRHSTRYILMWHAV